MIARPILFSGPMIRALLREVAQLGTGKTQTRRMLKYPKGSGTWDSNRFIPGVRVDTAVSPYGKAGDLLWCREMIGQRSMENFLTGEPTNAVVAAYAVDDCDVVEEAGFNVGPWWGKKGSLPSIHMPRWASRLTLQITGVRVERLQDISEEDAKAEGWPGTQGDDLDIPPRLWFRTLWQSINGPDSWDANPWVWVIGFTPHLQNVDAFLEARAA